MTSISGRLSLCKQEKQEDLDGFGPRKKTCRMTRMVLENSEPHIEAVLNDRFLSVSGIVFKTCRRVDMANRVDELPKLKMVSDFSQSIVSTELASNQPQSFCWSQLLSISNDEFIEVDLFRMAMSSMRYLDKNIFRLKMFEWILTYLEKRPPCNSIIRDYYDAMVNKDTFEYEQITHSFLKFSMEKTVERLIKLIFYINKKEEYKKVDSFDDWLARDSSLVVKLKDSKPKLELGRLFLLFDVYAELLHLDLKNFIGGNEADRKKWENELPIINKTIWGCDVPSVSQHCQKVIYLLCHVPPQFQANVQRYIFLIGEAMRLMDKVTYSSASNPYLGSLCRKFAIEFSKQLNDITDDETKKGIIEGILLAWLKILVTYCLYTDSVKLHEFDLKVLANSLKKMTSPIKKRKKDSSRSPSTSNALPDKPNCDASEIIHLPKEKSFLLYNFFTAYVELYRGVDAQPQKFVIPPEEKKSHSIVLKKINAIVQKLNTPSNGSNVEDENILGLGIIFEELMASGSY